MGQAKRNRIAKAQEKEGWIPRVITRGMRFPDQGILEAGRRLGGVVTLSSAQPQVYLVVPNLTKDEVRAFENDKVTLTVVHENGMCWLAVEFGDAMLGYDGSYNVNLDGMGEAARLLLQDAKKSMPYTDTAPFVLFYLIDANTGVVKGMRQIASAPFCNGWMGAALEQIAPEYKFDQQRERAWAKAIADKYTLMNIRQHPAAVSVTYPGTAVPVPTIVVL